VNKVIWDHRREFPMYEEYYGLRENPFSLAPDPRYLFRSVSHDNGLELLRYAIRRREGFVVVTGDIGTGKTTLCRAMLEQLDRRTFTALVLNPFLSPDDLLRTILLDFGVASREEIRRGRLAGVSGQALIDTLNEFLLSLIPLGAAALVIIDEAQNLPPAVLEQIRILSNLETNRRKLLQIVLVGQLNLKDVLRTPELRQLNQRISARLELTPLTRNETSAYVAHRLDVAGHPAAVTFAPAALDLVHRCSGGEPRVINLLCDRALLDGCVARAKAILPRMVLDAANSLELGVPRPSGLRLRFRWRRPVQRRADDSRPRPLPAARPKRVTMQKAISGDDVLATLGYSPSRVARSRTSVLKLIAAAVLAAVTLIGLDAMRDLRGIEVATGDTRGSLAPYK
jgi:general secretion pathway protein A